VFMVFSWKFEKLRFKTFKYRKTGPSRIGQKSKKEGILLQKKKRKRASIGHRATDRGVSPQRLAADKKTGEVKDEKGKSGEFRHP